MPENPHLAKLRKLLEAAYEDHPTTEDLKVVFKALSQAIKDLHDRVTTKATSDVADLTAADKEQAARIDDAHGRIDDANVQIASAHDRIATIKLTPGPKGDKGDQGAAGRDGKDGRDGRDGGDGAPGKDGKDGGGAVRIGWGAHPLTIQALGVPIDKNTRFINFTGSGLGSVSRSVDGVVTVNITGGSCGGGTIVSEEVPTDSGDHLNFTIAHEPIDGTFKLYRGGARQASIGVTPDYTLTGTDLVLGTALNSAQGEQLFCDYEYV